MGLVSLAAIQLRLDLCFKQSEDPGEAIVKPNVHQELQRPTAATSGAGQNKPIETGLEMLWLLINLMIPLLIVYIVLTHSFILLNHKKDVK